MTILSPNLLRFVVLIITCLLHHICNDSKGFITVQYEFCDTIIIRRHGQSQGLLYKHCNLFIHSITTSLGNTFPLPPIALQRRQAQTVRNLAPVIKRLRCCNDLGNYESQKI